VIIPERTSPVVGELVGALGLDRVVVDADVLGGYRRDHTGLIDAGWPVAVVRAASVADVVATLRVASVTGTPVVTRGAGTGLAGGANAIDGCVVLVTAAMNRILEIDEVQRLARVECGVLNGDLAAAVAERGLWYAPDPASRAISTIGGNIATNAGGACCLKYGVTGDHVAALTAVLADGSVIRTGAVTRKNVAGLDLTRLLVGSEGVLAVIVEATLRLLPRPRRTSTMAAFFPTAAMAGRAITAMEAVMTPSLLELMDHTTIGVVESTFRMGLDTTAGALLLAQSDSMSAPDEMESCAQICRSLGASEVVCTDDPEDGEMFLTARRNALVAFERLGPVLLDDVAVPKSSIPAMIEAIEEIAKRHGVTIGTFGHAGDGNLHPTIVFSAGDEASERAAAAAFDDIVRAALRLGGTITGEHGVGTLKQRFLSEMLGGIERDLMRRVKTAFDPNGILNPGKAL
jgi:glycolate oxidase